MLISAIELLISTIRISDINNLHELVISLIRIIDITQQFKLVISIIPNSDGKRNFVHNYWYQQFELVIAYQQFCYWYHYLNIDINN